MSAGSGVMHSEFNHAPEQQTHFLQIWIEPNQPGIEPGYEQVSIDPAAKRGQLALVAAPQGGPQTVKIHADASLYAGLFDGAEQAELLIDPKRKAYVHLIQGELRVNGVLLQSGDAALLKDEPRIFLQDGANAQVLVFDLAAV
jgi:hypothetical protein